MKVIRWTGNQQIIGDQKEVVSKGMKARSKVLAREWVQGECSKRKLL